MAAINYIPSFQLVLSSQIDNTYMQSISKQRTKKEHFISITHYEIDGVYDGSLLVFHWSYEKKVNYKHINIFTDVEYNCFIKSYQNRDTIYKGTVISYSSPVYKNTKTKRPSPAQLTISDEIFIELEQPHYTVDKDDTTWFRKRTCIFHDHVFPTRQIRWVQKQNRPALYIDSLDSTARFDSNSMFVYINASKVSNDLKKIMRNINHGYLDRTTKIEEIRKFAKIWYTNTLFLWYINWSWSDEWNINKLNYETMLNLGYYFLRNINVFDEDDDWLECVKQSYVEYLFMKELWNDGLRGIKHSFRDLRSKSLRKETRYMFPDKFSKLQKTMFKAQFPTPTQDRLLERNKRIKELHNQGKSERQIAKEIGCSKTTVHIILNT